MLDTSFWNGRRVLLTGHTGFKGAWMAMMLGRLGASTLGVGLEAEPPSLFDLAGVRDDLRHVVCDLADAGATRAALEDARPEIVFHFAAEALVLRANRRPAETFATNVMGTVNLLEALRALPPPLAILVVTTDKVYRNDNGGRLFEEDAPLGGREPYSASKVGQEMVARAYGDAYFEPAGSPVATARAGNVVGGGDFAADRLVPDLVRAAITGKPASIRHPDATRPWQHVLDCLAGYLGYAEALALGRTVPRALNFGPRGQGMTVAELAASFARHLGRQDLWLPVPGAGLDEATTLAISAEQARATLGWREFIAGTAAVNAAAVWYRHFLAGKDMRRVSLADLDAYLSKAAT